MYVCVYVCMYVRMYVCMYGPVSRVPCSRERELGGPYHWGGPGIRSPDSYIYIIDHSIHTCTGTYVYEIVHENICIIISILIHIVDILISYIY